MTHYVTEHRNSFTGGYCTAYLMEEGGDHFVHTITRMDAGCFAKTDPFKVREGADTGKLLSWVASLLPMLHTGEPSNWAPFLIRDDRFIDYDCANCGQTTFTSEPTEGHRCETCGERL